MLQHDFTVFHMPKLPTFKKCYDFSVNLKVHILFSVCVCILINNRGNTRKTTIHVFYCISIWWWSDAGLTLGYAASVSNHILEPRKIFMDEIHVWSEY